MLRIGITGGIGSGKSTVCRVFEELGISVYYADAETKKMYAENDELKSKIIAHFGTGSYKNGTFDRTYISQKVFNDPKELEALNSIVHPYVFQHYDQWCDAHKNEKYSLKEAAILFESGSYKQLDHIVGVIASVETRIARTMGRDSLSREEVLQRIQKQMPTDELIKRCDYIVENDGEKSVVEQVIKLHNKFTQLAEEKPIL